MNTFFWLSFFFASPPHQATCAPHGTPLLEIRERAEIAMPTATTKIYASGAWTYQPVDKDGRKGAASRGCFSKKELRQIRKAVQRAPWQITKSPIRCFAYDPSFTQYLVRGRLRFTERMCSGTTADLETMEALSFVKQKLAAELPPLPDPESLF